MDKNKKKPWTRPVLRKLEPTPELLSRFTALADELPSHRPGK